MCFVCFFKFNDELLFYFLITWCSLHLTSDSEWGPCSSITGLCWNANSQAPESAFSQEPGDFHLLQSLRDPELHHFKRISSIACYKFR